MVLRLLLNFSVASMNKLSMGVFWERRSFIWRRRERHTLTRVTTGLASDCLLLSSVPSPSCFPCDPSKKKKSRLSG